MDTSKTYMIERLDSPTLVNFTIGEFLDSIEKNGLKQAVGRYWDSPDLYGSSDTLVVNSACAIGQAALNLGIHYDVLEGVDIPLNNGRSLVDSVINKNDSRGWSFGRIARHYRKLLADRLNETISVEVYKRYAEVE